MDKVKTVALHIAKTILGLIVVALVLSVASIPIILVEITDNPDYVLLYIAGIGLLASWAIGHIVWDQIKWKIQQIKWNKQIEH